MTSSPETWDDHLSRLPTAPGVYLMRGAGGEILYVGKAGNVRRRVRSYFRAGGDGRRLLALLLRDLADIEAVVVANEKEALLLENQLIKEHQPRYNVQLKDDKNYLSIRLDTHHPWPRVELVRRQRKDGARYFGPYESASAVRKTLRVLNRHFQLRTCSDKVLYNRSRPCILYQIKRCPAPCVYDVDRDGYERSVEDAAAFLNGRRDSLVRSLRQRMEDAAEALRYEQAARLRDLMRAVEQALIPQRVIFSHGRDEDAIGYARAGEIADIQILQLRKGHLRRTVRFSLSALALQDAEVLRSFVQQHYSERSALPHTILLPLPFADQGLLEDLLTERSGRKVTLRTPSRGGGRRLLETATANAQRHLDTRQGDQAHREQTLSRLAALLSLPKPPEVIDCCDISLFQGSAAVGSMVRFRGGQPEKKGYRHFRIRTVEGTDDYAMLYEVISRHMKRCAAAGELPDLLLIDGGKGQLNVGRAALGDLGLDDMHIASLAKSRARSSRETVERSPERIFLPDRAEPIIPAGHDPALLLLAALRDEAHRFALRHHRKRRKGQTLRSDLDPLPGIGESRRSALLKHFGSVAAIREASSEALQEVKGIGPQLAARIKSLLA